MKDLIGWVIFTFVLAVLFGAWMVWMVGTIPRIARGLWVLSPLTCLLLGLVIVGTTLFLAWSIAEEEK